MNTQTPVEMDLPNGLQLVLESTALLPAARYVVDEVFHERQYSRDGFEIGESDTVVDVGANVGVFSLWAAPQASRGRVVSVEPIPNLADCLGRSLTSNRIGNVTLVQTALGSGNGRMELLYYPGFNIISHRVDFRRPFYARLKIFLRYLSYWSGPRTITVPQTTLPKLLADEGIDHVDFLKIDCEGSEYAIFEGMRSEDWLKIDRMVIEFHEYHQNHRHEELVRVLHENGFEICIQKNPMAFRLMRFGTLWARRRRP